MDPIFRPAADADVKGAPDWSPVMSNAMEELMRLHPASHYGRREHRPSGSVRDERDERLERAGYLLVVGIDHLVHAIAAVGWRIVWFLARRSATAERRSEGRTKLGPSQLAREQRG